MNNEIGLKASKDSNLSSLGISATKLEMRDHNTFPIVMNSFTTWSKLLPNVSINPNKNSTITHPS